MTKFDAILKFEFRQQCCLRILRKHRRSQEGLGGPITPFWKYTISQKLFKKEKISKN